MSEGFIILHRKFKSWYGYGCGTRVHLWLELLIEATHTSRRVILRGQPYQLKRGQILTTGERLASVIGVGRTRTIELLNEFENEEMIRQQKTNRGRLISIINYDQYQIGRQQSDARSDSRATSERHDNKNNNETMKQCNKSIQSDGVSPQVKKQHFEEIWSRYPRKDGKKRALRSFMASVKSEADVARISRALGNYLNTDTVRRGIIKNGSTWFNQWEDFEHWKDPKSEEQIEDDIASSLLR